jgi:hypothetical protein
MTREGSLFGLARTFPSELSSRCGLNVARTINKRALEMIEWNVKPDWPTLDFLKPPRPRVEVTSLCPPVG